jgi:UDP-N-acetyl-D-glucosamine dehydrogenase
MLVILESTTYPGTTEEVILPILNRSGLNVGEDFFLCFSPERVDPGNPRYNTRNIPKVIGGITAACTEAGALLYSQAVDRVVAVSSTRVAEMVKLTENTFRMINIGLANEMALMCDCMKIDVWEVIEAAATKPFGFMPFYPGPGLGGHCIPVDPHYLSWKTKLAGHEPRFIELAARINGSMPRFVAAKVQNVLNDHAKPVRGSRIHIAGVAGPRHPADLVGPGRGGKLHRSSGAPAQPWRQHFGVSAHGNRRPPSGLRCYRRRSFLGGLRTAGPRFPADCRYQKPPPRVRRSAHNSALRRCRK